MNLETMQPNVEWEPAGYETSIAALGAEEYEFHVFGGDWCIDCQEQLPDFAAALSSAGIDPDTVHHYPVEKEDDGSKTGPGVEEYGIEYIPTVVVEHDGKEVARFVESESLPIAPYLGKELQAPNDDA